MTDIRPLGIFPVKYISLEMPDGACLSLLWPYVMFSVLCSRIYQVKHFSLTIQIDLQIMPYYLKSLFQVPYRFST